MYLGIESTPYAPPSQEFLLGTDALGRSFLPRLLEGTAFTLVEVGLASLLALVIGTIIGALGALLRGNGGRFFFRVASTLSFSTPLIAVLLLIYSLVGDRFYVFPLSAGLLLWGPTAMTVQTVIGRERSNDYMRNARALGLSLPVRFLYHFVPVICPAIKAAWLACWPIMLTAHLLAAYLGAHAGRPSLGVQLKTGYELFPVTWWLWLPPTLIVGVLFLLLYRMINLSNQRSGA